MWTIHNSSQFLKLKREWRLFTKNYDGPHLWRDACLSGLGLHLTQHLIWYPGIGLKTSQVSLAITEAVNNNLGKQQRNTTAWEETRMRMNRMQEDHGGSYRCLGKQKGTHQTRTLCAQEKFAVMVAPGKKSQHLRGLGRKTATNLKTVWTK